MKNAGYLLLADQMLQRYGAKGVRIKWWDDERTYEATIQSGSSDKSPTNTEIKENAK